MGDKSTRNRKTAGRVREVGEKGHEKSYGILGSVIMGSVVKNSLLGEIDPF